MAYLWSEISGPNVPVIASEGSQSTRVRGLVAGAYIFQLMAVDTFGLTGVDTLTLKVTGGGEVLFPVTLAPIYNPNEFCLIGNSVVDYSEKPNPRELGAETWTQNSYTVAVRGGVRFDLSGLPSTNIKSAYLTLFSNPTPFTANLSTPNFGTANAMYIQRIGNSWNPATITWNNQPLSDTTGQILIPQSNLSSLDLSGVDVTALVKDMLVSGNYGFMLRLQTESIYNSRIFCSSRYSDSTKRPQLVINF